MVDRCHGCLLLLPFPHEGGFFKRKLLLVASPSIIHHRISQIKPIEQIAHKGPNEIVVGGGMQHYSSGTINNLQDIISLGTGYCGGSTESVFQKCLDGHPNAFEHMNVQEFVFFDRAHSEPAWAEPDIFVHLPRACADW